MKKCDIECLTHKYIILTYLKRFKCLKTEFPFSVPWTRTWLPFIFNGVLENVLVCAQLSSKRSHGTFSLCFIMQLFRFIFHSHLLYTHVHVYLHENVWYLFDKVVRQCKVGTSYQYTISHYETFVTIIKIKTSLFPDEAWHFNPQNLHKRRLYWMLTENYFL